MIFTVCTNKSSGMQVVNYSRHDCELSILFSNSLSRMACSVFIALYGSAQGDTSNTRKEHVIFGHWEET
jgi:hypothetical protein